MKLLIFLFLFVIKQQALKANGKLAPLYGSAEHQDKHNLKPLGILNDQVKLNLTIVTGSLAKTELVSKYFSSFTFLTIMDQTEMHLKLQAMAGQFSQVFNTTFVEYKCPNKFTNHVCYATTSEVYIPDSLHTAIVGILGLEQVLTLHHHLKVVENSGQKQKPSLSPGQYFLGSQAASVYGVPVSTGAGIKVGIISVGGYFRQSDLNTFFSYNNLGTAPTINIVYVDGATQNYADGNSATENYLDIEIISSVVPQATITLYLGPNTNQGFYDVFLAALQNNNVVSCSWGLQEYGTTKSYMQTFQTLFSTYSKVPVFVATGDAGSYATKSSSVGGAGFPASCPNAIGRKYFLIF